MADTDKTFLDYVGLSKFVKSLEGKTLTFVTKAEYDALGDDVLTDNKIYGITDTKTIIRNGVKFGNGDATGGGSGEGASSSENVSYENSNFADISNVEEALNKLFSKVYYVAPSVTSFTSSPASGNREIGQKVSSITFNWAVNKDIVSQTLTGCTVALADRTATYNTELSANKTFTVTVKDDTGASATKSLTFNFLPKVYYGSAALPGSVNSAFVVGLSSGELKSSRGGTYTINVANDQYGFVCFPASFGTPTCKIGGFDTDLIKVSTLDVTNASGYTQSYNVYRTPNPSMGSASLVIS